MSKGTPYLTPILWPPFTNPSITVSRLIPAAFLHCTFFFSWGGEKPCCLTPSTPSHFQSIPNFNQYPISNTLPTHISKSLSVLFTHQELMLDFLTISLCLPIQAKGYLLSHLLCTGLHVQQIKGSQSNAARGSGAPTESTTFNC